MNRRTRVCRAKALRCPPRVTKSHVAWTEIEPGYEVEMALRKGRASPSGGRTGGWGGAAEWIRDARSCEYLLMLSCGVWKERKDLE